MVIEKLKPEHAPAVQSISEEGINTRIATFTTALPSWEEWDKSHLPHSRLVAMQDKEVIGWAALTPVSSRCVYAGVAEVSVYVKANARGRGVGKELLQQLVTESEENNLWMLQSSVIAANTSSIALHHAAGFRTVGYREKLGQFKGEWHDVVLLEKRSHKINY